LIQWKYVHGIDINNINNEIKDEEVLDGQYYISEFNKIEYKGEKPSDGTIYSGKDLHDSKYYDLYITIDPTTACDGVICYGYALSETKNWYSDYSGFVNKNSP